MCRRFLLCGGLFSCIGGDDKSGTLGGGNVFSTVVGDVIFGSVGVVQAPLLSLDDDGETISTTFAMLDIVVESCSGETFTDDRDVEESSSVSTDAGYREKTAASPSIWLIVISCYTTKKQYHAIFREAVNK